MPAISVPFGGQKPFERLHLTDYKTREAQGKVVSREVGEINFSTTDGRLPDTFRAFDEELITDPQDARLATILKGEAGWRESYVGSDKAYFQSNSNENLRIYQQVRQLDGGEAIQIKTEIGYSGGDDLMEHRVKAKADGEVLQADIRFRERRTSPGTLTGDGLVDDDFYPVEELAGSLRGLDSEVVTAFLSGEALPDEWEIKHSKYALPGGVSGQVAKRVWRTDTHRVRQFITLADPVDGNQQRRLRLSTQVHQQVQEGGTCTLSHNVNAHYDAATGEVVKSSLTETIGGPVGRPGTGEALNILAGPDRIYREDIGQHLAQVETEPTAVVERFAVLKDVTENTREALALVPTSLRSTDSLEEQAIVLGELHQHDRLELGVAFRTLVEQKGRQESLTEAWSKLKALADTQVRSGEEALKVFEGYQKLVRQGQAPAFDQLVKDFVFYGKDALPVQEVDVNFVPGEVELGDFLVSRH